MLIFVEGGKHENLEKNPWSKARTNNNLTPHIGHAGCSQTWATFVVGQCSHLHCAIPAPPKGYDKYSLYELVYETPNILINYNYLERKHISISWFWCGSSILVDWNLDMLVFVEGGKPREPRKKNPWEQGRNQQQTQPTYSTLVGGKHSRRCIIPAPLPMALYDSMCQQQAP